MIKNRFSLFLIASLVLSIFAALPAVYASPRADEFTQCLNSKTDSEDCSVVLNKCSAQLDEKYESFNEKYSECTQECSSEESSCIANKCSPDGCYPPEGCGQPGGFDTGRRCSSEPSGAPTCSADGRACSCSTAQCEIDCENGVKSCRSDCQDYMDKKNDWWGYNIQTSEGYEAGGQEIIDLRTTFSIECASQSELEFNEGVPEDTTASEVDVLDLEIDQLEAEKAALLEGRTGGDKITPIPGNAKKLSVEEDKSLSANSFFNQLQEVLSGSGKESLSGEQVAAAIKAYRARITNAQKGQAITVELPQRLMVQSMTAITAQPISDAVTTITLINEAELGKAVPLFEKKGIMGNPDYPIPRAPLGPPESDKYLVKEYFKVDTSGETEYEVSKPFYERVWFKFTIESSVEAAKNTVLLRYDENTNKWNPLPTQHILSVVPTGLVQFTAESPGTSYFAIAVKKESSNTLKGILFWTLALIAWITILFYSLKSGTNKEYEKFKNAKSLNERISILQNLGFKKLVLKLGTLQLGGFFIAYIIISALTNPAVELGIFLIIFVALFSGFTMGFLVGLITFSLIWGLSKVFKK